MRHFVTVLIAIFVLSSFSKASNIEVSNAFDFNLALTFAAGNGIDTLILTTPGSEGVYTTTDTNYFAVKAPVVILPSPGLNNPPIFTHSAADSNILEIFRIMDDVTFEGIIFDGGHELSHGMKYGVRVGNDEPDINGNIFMARVGLNVTINNCVFRNFYQDKVASADGHGVYFLIDVFAGNVKITNSTFQNIGYEAIRMTETEKYATERCLDTLIVQNCTFNNIDNECVRFYHDQNPQTDDAHVLLENITIYNSDVRSFFVKNASSIPEGVGGETILRNVISANARLDTDSKGRSDYVSQIQGTGSHTSHIDTFMMVFTPFTASEPIGTSKGSTVDTTTIYGFDPLFADPENGDFTLSMESQAYYRGFEGNHLGDLRWATNPPPVGLDINDEALPNRFTLRQNYPNPFNPSTMFEYTIPANGLVKLTIHDITGRQIAELVNTVQTVGTYTVSWNSNSRFASGIYFYRLQTGNQVRARKMMLLK